MVAATTMLIPSMDHRRNALTTLQPSFSQQPQQQQRPVLQRQDSLPPLADMCWKKKRHALLLDRSLGNYAKDLARDDLFQELLQALQLQANDSSVVVDQEQQQQLQQQNFQHPPSMKTTFRVKEVYLSDHFISKLPSQEKLDRLLLAVAELPELQKLRIDTRNNLSGNDPSIKVAVRAMTVSRILEKRRNSLVTVTLTGLQVASSDDIQRLAAALQNHESIRQLGLLDLDCFVISLLHFASGPRCCAITLDPLLKAVGSIPCLDSFDMTLSERFARRQRRHRLSNQAVYTFLSNPSLQAVSLWDCALDNEHVLKAIVPAVQNHACLQFLSLRRNLISDWNLILKMTESNYSLTHFYHDSAVDPPEQLLAVIADNFTSTTTTATPVQDNEEIFEKINLYLYLNQLGRGHLLSLYNNTNNRKRQPEEVLESWLRVLQAAARQDDDLTALYYLVQQAPSLLTRK